MNKSADLVVSISLFTGWLGIVLGGLSVLASLASGDPIIGFGGGSFVGLGITVLLAAYAVQSVFHIAKNSDEQIKVARENERLLQQLIRHGLPNSMPPANDTKLRATRHAPSRSIDDSQENMPKLSSTSNLTAGERVIDKRKSGDFVIMIVEGANNHRRYLVGQASFSSLAHAEEFIALRK